MFCSLAVCGMWNDLLNESFIHDSAGIVKRHWLRVKRPSGNSWVAIPTRKPELTFAIVPLCHVLVLVSTPGFKTGGVMASSTSGPKDKPECFPLT